MLRDEEVQVGGSTRARGRRPVRSLVWLALPALLVVGLALDTTFLSPEEAAVVNPPPFDAAVYASEALPELTEAITTSATDLTELAPAVVADPAAAGQELGTDVGSGRFGFATTVTGTVGPLDGDFVTLDVPGMPPGAVVRIPLGAGLSGAPVRDVTGEVRFGDFPSQSAYQSVANELGLLMRSQVVEPADLPGSTGRPVTVVGAFVTGGPPESFLIQPVSIEVGA